MAPPWTAGGADNTATGFNLSTFWMQNYIFLNSLIDNFACRQDHTYRNVATACSRVLVARTWADISRAASLPSPARMACNTFS